MRRPSRSILLPKIGLASTRMRLAATRRALSDARTQAAGVQQRFDSLFAHNPDAVYALDLNGRCVAANQACETLTGWSIDELLNMTDWSPVISGESAVAAGEHARRAYAGDAHDFELTIHHKSGRRVELHLTNIPIIEGGQVVGVYAVAKDITLRRRLLELTQPMTATSSVETQVNLILDALREVLPYDS